MTDASREKKPDEQRLPFDKGLRLGLNEHARRLRLPVAILASSTAATAMILTIGGVVVAIGLGFVAVAAALFMFGHPQISLSGFRVEEATASASSWWDFRPLTWLFIVSAAITVGFGWELLVR